MHIRPALILPFFLLPSLLWAQSDNTRFQRFAIEDGLTDYAVMSLHQDRQGYIWIGTQGTLFRFDGHAFNPFTPVPGDSNSLSHGFIYTIEEDADGNLWIGTRGGGLNKYDPLQERFYRYMYDSTSVNSLRDNNVRAIYPDDNGRIWIGTNNGVLHELDPDTGEFKWYFPSSNDQNSETGKDIFDIHKSSRNPNEIWVGRADGLYRFNQITKRFDAYQHIFENTSSLSSNSIFCIFEDDQGVIWIGTSKEGLIAFDPETEEVASYRMDPSSINSIASDDVSSITQDAKGRLWIGTYSSGLSRFDPHTGVFTSFKNELDNPLSLSHDVVTAVICDRNGLVWIGTYVGLNNYNPVSEDITFYGLEQSEGSGLSHPEVLSIIESKNGTVWLGTNNGGLNRLDRKTNKIQYYFFPEESPLNRINVVFEDSYGRLWLGTDNDNLYRFNADTGDTTRIVLKGLSDISTIQTIYESPNNPGVIWVGTSHSGFYKYEVNSGIVKHYHQSMHPEGSRKSNLSNNYVTQLYQDRSGVFWIATWGGGINIFDERKDTFMQLRHDPMKENSLSSDDVTSIFEDDEGIMWFGTPKGGLNKLNRETKTFKRYSAGSGDIGGILSDRDNFLWLNSSNGIIRFDPETEKFIKLGVIDGMQGPLFRDRAHFKGINGDLYFGGINGLNIFNPQKIQINTTPSPTVLTKVLISDEEQNVMPGDTLDLSYDENFLVFEFATLDYANPTENRYSYFLSGQDKNWVDAGNTPFARYSKLSHGDYTFKVRGANHLGILNTEDISLTIKISPPWWDTWWFQTLVLLFVVSFITALYRYRVAKLLEMERMRIRIASDLHDDLGGKLSGIAVLTDLVQSRAALKESDKNRLEKVSDTARLMVGELRDIVWFIKPEHDSMDDLIFKLQNIAETRLANIEYTFEIGPGVSSNPLKMDTRRHFLLYYKEILHNIIKHAHATRVTMRLEKKNEQLVFVISDNGVGFEESKIKKGEGLDNLRYRANSMKGIVKIESIPGVGTTITLHVKIPKAHDVLGYLKYYTSIRRIFFG